VMSYLKLTMHKSVSRKKYPFASALLQLFIYPCRMAAVEQAWLEWGIFQICIVSGGSWARVPYPKT